ncbi:hypothetical protein CEP51_004130 [Fusarium floridanum]|uniref:Uncharacterized protein n=1 Tax=Fusarium floridanum TaxID=1325733 RepID=A0A428S2W6_9HYPO|nr:hypothetical protein CEP51_004130 [Fusarium floridanum]
MVQRMQLRGQIESREILFPSDLKCSLLKQFTARTHGISTFAAVKSCADEIEASNRGATGWRSRTLGPGCPGRYMGKAPETAGDDHGPGILELVRVKSGYFMLFTLSIGYRPIYIIQISRFPG